MLQEMKLLRSAGTPNFTENSIQYFGKPTKALVNYSKEILMDTLVLGVVNFPPRQIGPEVSEVLILGVPDKNGECVLIEPEHEVPIGGRLY